MKIENINFLHLSHDTMHPNYFEKFTSSVPRNAQLAGIQKGRTDSEKSNHLVSCMSSCQSVKHCNTTQLLYNSCDRSPERRWRANADQCSSLHPKKHEKKKKTIYVNYIWFPFLCVFLETKKIMEFIFHHLPLISLRHTLNEAECELLH